MRRSLPCPGILLAATLALFATGCATCPWCGRPLDDSVYRPDPGAGIQPAWTLRGSVTYLQRIAMHPSAEIVLRLLDLSQTPAQVVAERTLSRPGQVPIDFEWELDPELIHPGNDYGLSAVIHVDDTVLFITDTDYRVLTHGHPANVHLVLARPESRSP